MEIGRMNQRIDILGNIKTADRIGNHRNTWQKLFSVWAEVYMRNSLTAASEKTAAGITHEIQQIVFRIRQTADTRELTATTIRIRFQGHNANNLRKSNRIFRRSNFPLMRTKRTLKRTIRFDRNGLTHTK